MLRHQRLATIIATAALGLTVSGITAGSAQADNQITVDTSKAIRNNAEHVASGGLYAMSDGSTPSADLLSPLKPKTFTQPGPGARQIPNGEPKAAGDFTSTAPLAHKVGSKVIVRLADIYDQWPYNYSNEQDWLKRVDTMVQSAQRTNPDDVYGYELWNEPNGTWQGANGICKGNWGDFDKVWQDTYKEVKKLAPNAKIVGPSLNSWQPTWMKHFLTMARDTKTLPDVISWHQWGAAKFPEQAAELGKLEDSLGISQRPISINEYGSEQELAVPGQMIHYVQNFENVSKLDSADLAFWFDYGRMDNLLTDQHKPNGGYWLYKWYGDMSGQMDQTSTYETNGNLASVANTTADKGQTSVIFGGASGNTTINVNGLNQAKLGNTAKVEVKETPWYGVDTAVDNPKTVASGTVAVKNGSVQVPVKDMKAADGYQLVVTSANGASVSGIQYQQPQANDPIRVEAESGSLTGKAKTVQGSYASGNYFVGTMDSNDSTDTMKVNAPAAGNYQLEIGYANGNKDKKDATDKVFLNDKQLKDAVFPYTTGWTTAVPNVDGTRKTIQYGSVRLNKGENTLKLQKDASFAELDYAMFTPISQEKGSSVTTPTTPSTSSTTSSSSAVSSSSATSSSSSASVVSSSSSASTPSSTSQSSSSQKETSVNASQSKKSLAVKVAKQKVASTKAIVKRYHAAYRTATKFSIKQKALKAYEKALKKYRSAQAELVALKHPGIIQKAQDKMNKTKKLYRKATSRSAKSKALKAYRNAKIALNNVYEKYSK